MPVSVPSLTMGAAVPFAVQLRHQPVWAAATALLLDRTVATICCTAVTPWPITALIHRLLGAVPAGEVVWTHELSAADAHALAGALSGDDRPGSAAGWAWQVSCLLEAADSSGDRQQVVELTGLLARGGFDRDGTPSN
ncbi:hypothetical protein DVS28_b0334 (plasmid) [Euzebya pacifica]|uniref:Uncharacterized protein n=1 Tax=Euzebya pacifica TaxID=1608957 RepID=A0A346Y6K7_9ACTN|nr:hypothetical protein [Euzebya pacifica]AXV10104.1 hypothetical protein DVS28_b0334 [Euzebya pacifica]